MSYTVSLFDESCGHKHKTKRAAEKCKARIKDNGDEMAAIIQENKTETKGVNEKQYEKI